MGELDGRFITGNQRFESSTKIVSENPATLEPLGEAFLASSEDCRRAVETAKHAFPSWKDLPLKEKKKIFLRAKKILLQKSTDVARLIAREKGSPLPEALAAEVLANLEALDYYGHNLDGTIRPRHMRPHSPLFAHKKSAFVFQPLGPSLIISPWNFPFLIPLYDIVSSLAAGNTVVLRPSSATPFTDLAVGEIFIEGGLPQGILSIVNCSVPQAEEMITNPPVQSILSAGSVSMGKRIMELASRNLFSCMSYDPFDICYRI